MQKLIFGFCSTGGVCAARNWFYCPRIKVKKLLSKVFGPGAFGENATTF
jgi:hypothetical protein